MSLLATLDAAVQAVRARSETVPVLGVVLGSGLGAWAERLDAATAIPYSEIPGMPVSTVQGHAGKLWLGRSNGVTVACLQGRVHMYEGHEPERAVFGSRLLARLGAKAVLLTNAAGGLSPWFAPGDLMLIRDHLNLMFKNPLIGPNEAALGPRFPDMTTTYDPALATATREAAVALGVRLHEGVYAGLLGPSYETPAEIRMLRVLARLGARAVLVTNAAGGLSPWFAPGDLMLIRDHLNLMFKNPLIGPNEAALGPRFPDMTTTYDPALAKATLAAATQLGVKLYEGVYAGLLGPSYETPAEIRMLRTLGADAVGMSTVPEAIALRHMRVPVTGISCITNLGAGISPHELSHAEVEEAANQAKPRFVSLVSAWIDRAAALLGKAAS